MEELSLIEKAAGLGRISKQMGPLAPREKQVAIEATKNALRSQVQTRNQKVLALKADKLTADEKAKIANGNGTFERNEVYLAKQIVAGTNELNKTPVDMAVGITNLDKGKVTASILVDTIIVEVNGAATSNADAISYENSFDAAGLPTAIANGEIEISSGGRVILPTTKLRKFFEVGGTAQAKRVAVKLESPEWMLANEKPVINVRLAENGALFTGAGVNTFMQVTAEGLQIKQQ